ncbi:MFS transporter [Paenibacillus naphthalenovorans]|uniref:MFS-type drug efflux transporter P55 n=1 Tax=Paenibacillus naphthalenovorans TaxID=162209 RepID=A0A0U2INI7_9BACL|nr:MFS transporter [Paenibacillus naphthalenovorans]ALS24715.1 DeoR family transcriptional regulator [Paenibacillus naphthalenovorans]
MSLQWNRMAVMTSIVLAVLISSIDTTIMNTTMPLIAEELGNVKLYAWSFASYMIICTIVTPLSGRISDIFGRKKVLAVGILIFLVGSILCGMASSMLELVLYRGVQGLGAGAMIAFPAIIAGDLFSVEARGKIQALFTGMWGLSAVLAPLLGSLFIERLTWRWIFYINIPICLASLLLLIPYREVYQARKSTINYTGSLLFGLGIGLLLLNTVVAEGYLLYTVLGLLFMALFIWNERRHPSPIVPVELMRNGTVAWMNLNAFLTCAALFGASSYIPYYLQHQGYSVFMSGLALIGMSVGWSLMGVPAGKWILKFGYRPLLVIGNALLVLSGLLLLFLPDQGGFWFVNGALLLQGMAFGLLVTVSVIGSQQLVDSHQKGISTSLQVFARNIGTAAGVTIMGALLTNAPEFMTGIHRLFLYGFIVALVALASTLFLFMKHENAGMPAKKPGEL